jgi:hypothetical protein
MRLVFRLACALCFSAFVVSGIRAAPPELLVRALEKLVMEEEKWAYTQVIRRGDKPNAETIARFDPSKPAAEQWQLVKLRGKTPSPAEAEKWCKRRTQEITDREARALVQVLDLDRARVTASAGEAITYEIPLKKNAIKRVPAENFVVFADVHSADQSVLRFAFQLRQAFRLIGGAAEVQAAEGEVIFKPTPDGATTRPSYAVASGSGQVLIKKINRRAEVFYVDQRRVRS